MDIINLDPEKKLYGVIVENKIFLASLCDLPNIIEGQKTLDFRTFYKSVDVSQILYIHNKVIDDINSKSPDELIKIAKDYNPVLEDSDFLNSLYRRGETKKMVEEMKTKGEEVKYESLKFRHGLAPVSKNIRNIRHKKEPNEDQDEVHAVEQILKDIIDYGFADNVEEELLEFDDNGDLKSCIKGAKEKRKEPINNNLIQIDYFGDPSARSESNYQGQFQFGADGQSSMYSVPVDQFDDGTSYRQDTVYNETQGGQEFDQSSQQQTYPQMQIQRNQSSAQMQSDSNQQQQQYMNQFNQSGISQTSNQANLSAGQFLNNGPQPMNQSANSGNFGYDQQMQFQQQPQYQQEDANMTYQQNQQMLPSQSNQIQDFNPVPQYTYQDYLQMKQDLKDIKKLIKSTKQDINESMQQGIDVAQLKDYYRQICAQKDDIKAQKKIAKRQLKSLQQQQQQQQSLI